MTATLEIVVESIIKFGEHFKDDVKVRARDALLPLLSDPRTGLRKKAMQGLGTTTVRVIRVLFGPPCSESASMTAGYLCVGAARRMVF